MEGRESEPSGPDTPPRSWRLRLTRIDDETALLLADDVSDARAVEKRLEAVLENPSELICRFTPDTTLTFVNKAYSAFFSRSTEQLVGRRFLDFVPEAFWPGIRERLEGITPDRSSAEYEHPMTLPDGG